MALVHRFGHWWGPEGQPSRDHVLTECRSTDACVVFLLKIKIDLLGRLGDSVIIYYRESEMSHTCRERGRGRGEKESASDSVLSMWSWMQGLIP